MPEAPMDGRGADPISDYLAVMTGSAPVDNLDGSRSGADCFGADERASVWKAGPPMTIIAPYRCGDSFTAAILPGPISAGMWALGFVAAIVLVELHRRRRVAWC